MECKHCKQKIFFDYGESINKGLKETQTCFSCDFWVEVIRDINVGVTDDLTKDIWVTEGYQTYYANKKSTRITKGHGGREFTAIKLDGSQVKSDDVWHRGTVPDHFRNIIHPNVSEMIDSNEN